MAEYGNNYDYGESPYYKDDFELPQSDLQLKIRGLLIQQFKVQYGIESQSQFSVNGTTITPPIQPEPVEPVTDINGKINSLLIQQVKVQYNIDSKTQIITTGTVIQPPEQAGTVIPQTDTEQRVNSLLIQQLRRQYGTGG